MKTLIFLTVAVAAALGQTTVNLQSSGPRAVNIVAPGCTNATPSVCTTSPVHNFSDGDEIFLKGLAVAASGTGTCVHDSGPPYNMSNLNGHHKVLHVIDSTHFSVANLNGSTFTPNGNWCNGDYPQTDWNYQVTGGGQVVAKLNPSPFTLTESPRVWFNGLNGSRLRQWALGTANGLTSLVVDSSHNATVTTSYTHGVTTGQHISVWDTTNNILNNGQNFAADYVVSSATSSTYAFPVDASIPAGDYTHNDHCGPGASPNGTIQGTDSCVRVSQGATLNNTIWSGHIWNSGVYWDPNSYKSLYDGGYGFSGVNTSLATVLSPRDLISQCVSIFWVHPTFQPCVDRMTYSLNHVERLGGVGFPVVEPSALSTQVRFAGEQQWADYGSYAFMYFGPIYEAAKAFLTPGQRQAGINKLENDLSDFPSQCVKNVPTQEVLAANTSQAGDATHITLAAGDTAPNGYYAGNIVLWINPSGTCNPGPSCPEIGRITAYNSSTKVATFTQISGSDAAGSGMSYTVYATITLARNSITTGNTSQSVTATTIKLANADARATGYYVNDYILDVTQGVRQGKITAYDGPTNTATIDDWSYGGTPSGNIVYRIFQDVVTGINTHFTTDPNIHVGGMIYGGFQGVVQDTTVEGTMILSVASDTLIIGQSGALPSAGSTPQIAWIVRPWQDADCGAKMILAYWGSVGGGNGQPLINPLLGSGSDTPNLMGVLGNNGSTNAHGHLNADFAMADDDARVRDNLTNAEISWLNYGYAEYANHMTGLSLAGSHYQQSRTVPDQEGSMFAVINGVQGFPALDTAGPVFLGNMFYKMYNATPDTPADSSGDKRRLLHIWGTQSGDCWWALYGDCQAGESWFTSYAIALNPTNTVSQYMKDFTDKNGVSDVYWPEAVVVTPWHLITPSDYTVQPHQYYHGRTSRASCVSLTGWPCPINQRGDAVTSRTGWSSPNDGSLFFEARYYSSDHDGPGIGAGPLYYYQTGYLLGDDQYATGEGDPVNPSAFDNVLNLNGGFMGGATAGQPSTPYISRWAAPASFWDSLYGDPNSRYMYAMADLGGAYYATYNHIHKHVAEFKKPGDEHIIIEYVDVDASNSPTPINDQVFYTQNGETLAAVGSYLPYDEGTTTCPGTGGCGSLNTNRQVLEKEDGSSSGAGNPTRNANLITRFISPAGAAPVYISWDGSTWSGSNGHADRVRICADPSSTGSCGSTANGIEVLYVHKVTTQPDMTLTTTALNPTADFTGVQTVNSVFLTGRHGTLYGSAPSFTTSHSGTAQYLIAGIAAGNYGVTVAGSPIASCNGVTGNVCTVVSGVNTIEFESTAGVVQIGGNAPAYPTTIAGKGSIAGSVVIH